MRQETTTPNDGLIPTKAMPDCAKAFTKQVHGLLDGQPKDHETVVKALDGMDAVVDLIAAGLYSLASMLVGEGEESIALVETTIATAEVSACDDPVQARQSSRRTLSAAALDILRQREPGSLDAPVGAKPAATCLEEDDVDAAGVAREDLARMIGGPDRDRVREWLQRLPTAVRAVFVLRAVAGFTAAETAELLVAHGGPKAAAWSAEGVRDFFRQGLCSLASQLIQASTT
jgi:DNA-directed RNA polymerase specialized sigma24 family protein